jgi:hypothetical protein
MQYWPATPLPMYCRMAREHVYESLRYDEYFYALQASWSQGKTCRPSMGYITPGFMMPPHCYTTLSDSPAQRMPGRFWGFPNPATDILHLDIEHPAGVLGMSILDTTTGKALLRRTDTAEGGWDIGYLPTGLYLLWVSMKDGSSL